MNGNRRSTREVWLPLLVGLVWFWLAGTAGLVFNLVALIPGLLCVSGGVAALQSPGEPLGRRLAALGGVVGIVFGALSIFALGLGLSAVLLALSLLCFWDAGFEVVEEMQDLDDLPRRDRGFIFTLKVSSDEALLGGMSLRLPFPTTAAVARIAREARDALEYFDANGWLQEPEKYHRPPLELDVPELRYGNMLTRSGNLQFEQMSFASEYEPRSEEPGRERWLSYSANRTAHAWMLRHPEPDRPWLLCIHGYQMGYAWMDLGLFDPSYLHEKLGFNLLLPMLPLHGRRKFGSLSGDGFLSGDLLDTIHAEAQAMWDIRRLVTWVRSETDAPIGAYGVSLGGYAASLLAALEGELSGVLAGVPVSDFADIFWSHGPAYMVRDFLQAGVTIDDARTVMRVVSPRAIAPKLPRESLGLYGGLGDCLVPVEQVRALWEHWDRPEAVWYQGSHCTFMGDADVRALIDRHLRAMQVAPLY